MLSNAALGVLRSLTFVINAEVAHASWLGLQIVSSVANLIKVTMTCGLEIQFSSHSCI